MRMHLVHPHHGQHQSGFTLVELMVAITLAMLLLLAGTTFFMTSRQSYASIGDTTHLEDKGQFALDVMVRLIRQSAWENWAPHNSTGGAARIGVTGDADASPNVFGLDNCADPTASLEPACSQTGIAGSDLLQIRFVGSGRNDDPTLPDDTMIDCAGMGVGEPAADNIDDGRGVAQFFIATGSNNVPELFCQFRERDASGQLTGAWRRISLVKGVESLHFLYGVDNNNDRVPDQFLPATAIGAITAAAWKRVVAVNLSMVMRGENASTDPGEVPTFSLFGPNYANPLDPGSGVYTPTTELKSQRRQFTASVQLRNAPVCSPMPCP